MRVQSAREICEATPTFALDHALRTCSYAINIMSIALARAHSIEPNMTKGAVEVTSKHVTMSTLNLV